MGRGDGDASVIPESPTFSDILWQRDAKQGALAMVVSPDRFLDAEAA